MHKRLNILTLHGLGNPSRRLKAVEELEFMLPLYEPEHNYLYLDLDYPVPDYVKELEFDAIIINPTFLCARLFDGVYAKTIEKFSFVKHLEAVKIAFPQDDYYSTRRLEYWLNDWDVDYLFTVLPDHIDTLYPNLKQSNIHIRAAYTGYVSNKWIEQWEIPKARCHRKIDVSYRTLKAIPCAGKLSYDKYRLGDRFVSKLPNNHTLKLDISSEYNKRIPGHEWHQFIENSKFCLVGKSGSSLFDPEGVYRSNIVNFVKDNPNWKFNELENNCFKFRDGLFNFTAISPRNLEAALSKTVQIASIGSSSCYSGLLNSYEHYIPIIGNFNNIDEILEIIEDAGLVEKIAVSCKEAILDCPQLRVENHCLTLMNIIKESTQTARVRNDDYFRKVRSLYWQELTKLGFKPSKSFPQLYKF
ncbi:hypothetical protein C2869_15680 [Saccharobesus litoralis]|uniref:Glycosyl transferases group 1 n=1 Tax=Saccharobesus litoralis TaxID=2172099 RepID=A0A2S0VU94_9ALTE|nr:hypothetical protein [Saccharobesus litoralis]AWB67775.1 hypothetical protein C2869_15680 [Saccharobesus litoralis]